MKKYLGIDWGDKRIGLAMADEETALALPFKTVPDLASVLKVIKEEEINFIVLGRPYQMASLEHNLDPNFLKFADLLIDQSGVSVAQVDERLSSLAADAMGGPKKMRAGRDEVAATLILQNYLEQIN